MSGEREVRNLNTPECMQLGTSFQHVVEDFKGYISSNAVIHKLALHKKGREKET